MAAAQNRRTTEEAPDVAVDIRDLHISFATDGEPVHAVEGLASCASQRSAGCGR